MLDYNCPCQKKTGFFFLPVSTDIKLVGTVRCSEMDILLNLWLSAVHRDEQVQGSFDGPVAYLHNGTGFPLVSYSELAQRRGLSKATVGRVLRKLERVGHIAVLTFPGKHRTAICLQNYLSTMFQISDVMVDKDEVAMSLNIQISTPDVEPGESLICVSNGPVIVSKPHEEIAAQKALQLLALQRVGCAKYPWMTYKLYPLSRDSQGIVERDTVVRRFRMDVLCPGGMPAYTFEISTRPVEGKGGFCHGEEKG